MEENQEKINSTNETTTNDVMNTTAENNNNENAESNNITNNNENQQKDEKENESKEEKTTDTNITSPEEQKVEEQTEEKNEEQKNEEIKEDNNNQENNDEDKMEEEKNEEQKDDKDNHEQNNEEQKEDKENKEDNKEEQENTSEKNNEEQKEEDNNENKNNDDQKEDNEINEDNKEEEKNDEETKNDEENKETQTNNENRTELEEEKNNSIHNEEDKEEEKEDEKEEEEKPHERSVYSLEGAKPPLSIYTRRVMDSSKIEDYLDDNSSRGQVGGRNLGNTCFMNSSIACLSNCTELTYYFLKGDYLKDINEDNTLGMGGRLAKEWGNLMKQYWVEQTRVGDPSDFKYVIGQKAVRFRGYGQQDSNEFMSVFLDYLNEDLNKTTKKEYVELKEKGENETDEQCARRFWDINLKRNDSIITDLFCGQYKSTITCPECGWINITFDPFDTINLPLLTQIKRHGWGGGSENVEEFNFFYIPKNVIREPICLKIKNVDNNEFMSSVIDRIKKEENFFYHDKIEDLLMVDMLRKEKYGYAEKTQLVKQFVYSDEFVFSFDFDRKKDEILLPVYFYSKNLEKDDKSAYPRMVICQKDQTLNDVRKKIYFYLRKYILSPFLKDNEEKDILSLELEKYMLDKNNELPDDKIYEMVEEEYNKVFKNYKSEDKNKDKEEEKENNSDEEKEKKDDDEDDKKDEEDDGNKKDEEDKENNSDEDNKKDEEEKRDNEDEEKKEEEEKKNEEENKSDDSNNADENKEKKDNENEEKLDENNSNEKKYDTEEKKENDENQNNENNGEKKEDEIEKEKEKTNNEENQENNNAKEKEDNQEQEKEEKNLSEDDILKKHIEQFKSDMPFIIFIRRERDDNFYYGKTPFIDKKHFSRYSKKLKELLKIEDFNCQLSEIQTDISDYEIIVQFNPDSKYINKEAFDLDHYDSIEFEYKIKKVEEEEEKKKENEEEDDGRMTLAKCLKKFCKEEQLQEGDEWYCSKCKKHVLAKKKLDLYYVPKILIICFKRFVKESSYRWEKNEDEVDFPVNNLDLKDFVIGPDKEHSKYDLFAVSQHYGDTGGGHYTAVCKNNGKWYSYNDSSCYESSESETQTSAAYVLFYRRQTD